MGQYEPDDSRDVTLNDGHEPGGIKRTGPRESETRQQDQDDGTDQQQEQQQGQGAQPGDQQQALDAQVGGARPEYDQYEVNQPGNINAQAEQAQPGYGNARDEEGHMEKEAAKGAEAGKEADKGKVKPGETSSRPDERAEADANRPLGKD
ncbi:hypothetical protein LCM19_09695 [Qipengyuania flava]|nr:hypothetical protein [Qipengyuania flava]